MSHVLEGAPAVPPGPNFDPSTVGDVTKIKGAKRTRAQVTMPTRLVLQRGTLCSSA